MRCIVCASEARTRGIRRAPESVLFLGPSDSPLISWMTSRGDKVIQFSDAVSRQFLLDCKATFLVSYGYRHILGAPVLNSLVGRAINLHISLLPWNRGADPNLWSFIDATPKGVSIHYLDEGVDTGNIIVQKEVAIDLQRETLATSYQLLHQELQRLFQHNWAQIKAGNCPNKPQIGIGSCHRSQDKERHVELLSNGWDTPVKALKV